VLSSVIPSHISDIRSMFKFNWVKCIQTFLFYW
jgi:hypothetical protein